MTSSTQKHVEPPHAFLRNIVVTTVQRSSGNQGKHWISLHFSQITITALYIQAVFNVCLFAIKIQFLLLRLKIYNSKSQMYLRAAGAWIQNTNIALSVWRLLNVLDNKGRDILMCVCACACARACVYVCVTDRGNGRQTHVYETEASVVYIKICAYLTCNIWVNLCLWSVVKFYSLLITLYFRL